MAKRECDDEDRRACSEGPVGEEEKYLKKNGKSTICLSLTILLRDWIHLSALAVRNMHLYLSFC